MSRIKILPEIISNKIAAGEVVERPASVVKELVENAIDAGSTRIMVEIENGGRSMIRVSDNGIGMHHDDALLSLERYATSKIENDADLFSIRTLGFRGEALPSISSVSRFTMVTRAEDSDIGTCIVVEGGKIRKVSEIGAPPGTLISVNQLFYNTPARRKFLKSTATEMGHIAENIASIALGWPEIQFRLSHNGKTIKNWPLADDPFDRITAVLGQDMQRALHKIDFETPYTSISGWISSPSLTRSTSQKIYVYVNKRYIRDRGLQHALFEGYRGRLMKGRFPVAVLFIEVPFEQLDVNVHPTKHEVRFAGYQRVYDALKASVFKAWDSINRSVWSDSKGTVAESQIREHPAEFRVPYSPPEEKEIPFNMRGLRKKTAAGSSETVTDYGQAGRRQSFANGDPQTPPLEREREETKHQQEGPGFSRLSVVGQIHDSYIVCESGDGLVLVDQHAAHERILFEQMKTRSSTTPFPIQKLLIPETIELGYNESVVLEKLIPSLGNVGLEVEPFGGNTFVVKSVPTLISDREVRPLILEMIERASDIGFSEGLEPILDECLILMACHGAVRANHRLSRKEMKALMEQMDLCENPSNCPHGRPTWIRWTLSSLEKSFKRIV